MSHGFRVFDSSGNIKLDVSDRLSRLVYFNNVASGSVFLPTYNPANGCHGFFNQSGGFAAGTVTYNNSTQVLSWSSSVPGAVFAIAVR